MKKGPSKKSRKTQKTPPPQAGAAASGQPRGATFTDQETGAQVHVETDIPEDVRRSLHEFMGDKVKASVAHVMSELSDQGKTEFALLLAHLCAAGPKDVRAALDAAKPAPAPLPRASRRQLQLLQFMQSFLQKHRYYPTHKEIAQALKIRESNVSMHLMPLAKKGYLTHGRRGEWALTEEAKLILDG